MLDIAVGRYLFQALPQRALYWPAQACLLVADLHLGKADTFRQFGIAVPQSVQRSDLERLSQLIAHLQPQRCVVLGDFVHGRIVHTETIAAWNSLVATHPQTRFELVLGNHDRHLSDRVFSWHGISRHLEMDGVWLTHEPLTEAQQCADVALNIHGHIHPAMRVDGSRTKLPAMVYHQPYLMLPAFSEFTAGVQAHAPGDKVWVFAQDASLVVRVR